MPATISAPADRPAVPESKFLAQARRQRAAWNAADAGVAKYWDGLSREKQEEELEYRAREYAIFAADVGRVASRVSDAIGDVLDAFEGFVDAFPDDEAREEAVRQAVADAGLAVPAGWSGAKRFGGFASDVKGWMHLMETMNSIFAGLAGPDAPEDEDEVPEAITAGVA